MRGKQSKSRHKDKNTFKFQSFSNRISDVKIDVFHRIKHINEEESDDETFLSQALDKWSLLNSSECYKELRKEITNVRTLPQIIKQKDHVVSVLLKHLDAKNVLDLQPVLELVVALAKDLRQDICCYYQDLHTRLISLLEIHNSDVLEWTFHCLAYLFKFLWRYLIPDLQNILESLMPLLSSSKPYYINNFAAECFAFVARKIKDQKKFLSITLKLLKKFPDGIDGCGRLLFEVVKGVSGRFHSSAEAVLPAYLEFHTESSITFKVFCQVITSAFSHIIKYIHPNHCDLLWKTLQDSLIKAIDEPRSAHNSEMIDFILNIIKIGVEYKSGALVKDSDSLAGILIKLIQPAADHTTKSIDSASEILSLLLLSHQVNLTQELASKIVVSAMSYLKEESLLIFMEHVLNYSGFDGLVLPRLLKYCSNHPIHVTMPLMTKLVIFRSPPSTSAHQIMDWQPFHLNCPSDRLDGSKSYDEQLLEELSSRCAGALVSNIDYISSCLIILPCINKVDRTLFIKILKDVLQKLCAFLNKDCSNCCDKCTLDDNDCNLIPKTLIILSLAVEACIKLRSDCPSKLCPPDIFLPAVLKYCQSEEYISGLRVLDLYVTSDELNCVAEFTADIKDKIWMNLMSPYHKVRLLSAHVLYELEKGSENGNTLSLQILEACWLTESTPATISDYREKLKYIQRLEVDCSLTHQSDNSEYVKPCIALLLGQLFVNFKLVWAPVCKVIASISQTFPTDVFWPLFYSQVTQISFLIREQSPPYKLVNLFEREYLSSMYTKLNDFDDRPDYINYRIMLWNAMKEFPDLCETKNRDVVAEFFRFLENEYFTHNSDLATTWNIKHISNDTSKMDETSDSTCIIDDSINTTLDQSELMDVDERKESMEVDGADEIEKVGDDKAQVDDDDGGENNEIADDEELEPEQESASYKWANKSLLVHLEVFGRFKTPKSVSRESELHKHYLDFLSHKLPDIQKAALECLLTYKDNFLVPYKHQLFNLIDDKTFHQEINRFRINTDSDVIKSDHRVDLIPLVLRIVYIKMYTGPSKGKNSKFARKAAVIRFLGGCTPEELTSYFKMAFPLFIQHVQEDAVGMVESIISSIDIEKAVPPRRLQSLTHLLHLLVVQTGGLLDSNTLGCLLRLVLCHAACAVGCLAQRNIVHSTYVKTLRGVRTTSFDILMWFFDKFQTYPWTANEVDAVFTVFVWSWIDKFHSDSANAPTPLLRLFSIWSQNPRYFILLSHWKELGGKKYSPLSALMELWLVKTHKSIYNIITDIVERLLVLIPSEDSGPDIMISQSPFTKEISFSDKVFSDLNFGSKLLLYHANSIMDKLKQKLFEGTNITGKELEIMSRVSELVMLTQKSKGDSSENTDSHQFESLFSLLLPILLKKASAAEHVTIALLTSLRNLAMIIQSPGQHVRTLAPLFAKINSSVPRRLLTSLVVTAHKRGGSDCDLIYEIVEDINAFNAKWLDQPDFDRRLDSFKKILKLMEQDKISFDLGLIIINTCFHFICNEKDLSLRDNSSLCLKTICPYLAKFYNGKDEALSNLLVNETILTVISNGIRYKREEFVRNECILLLGVMVRECPETHEVLNDLVLLANKNDLEMDFFENMQHLQHHRRLRAMVRLCETVKSYQKVPTPRSMTQFILPIVCYYLCNDKYTGRPTVIDCAVQALSAICRLLPHHQYLRVLKYYLDLLQKKNIFQKQLVRINIEILNAFHFDLSAAEKEVINSIEKEETEKGNAADITIEEDSAKDKQNHEAEENKDDNDVIGIPDGLDEIEENENDEEMETDTVAGPVTNILEQIEILPRSSSIKMVRVIKQDLIRKLQRALSQRTRQDVSHRTNKKLSLEDSDEQDMIRIPLAIAVVKLLQKLPPYFLDIYLSGVLMKVVSYLKSRVESVRRVTRKTLQEIAISLGPTQITHLVKEMIPILTRGFHVHVLAYTIHSILIALKPLFKQGDIDPALPHIIEVCRMDLFGDCSEEKEVVQILGKVLEARSCKSFDTFNIMAQSISEKYLIDLVMPLKEELGQTLSSKSVNKASECLRQIVLGLVENQFLSEESLLLFAYGSASESIPSLLPQKEAKLDPKTKEWQSRRPKDSLLIPAEPKRQKSAEMKACSRTNSHILVEFGLKLLHVLLRRDKIKDPMYLPHLDPAVKLLSDCLKSQHVKVSTTAMQCLCWVLKYDLPSLKEHINELTESLFAILHKYAASGLSKGDNFELVFVTFKAMGVLVRDPRYNHLSRDQMRVLLMYCEQDLDDHSRQATAFSLLKAVLVSKTNSPELPVIMNKVATMSITAPLDSVRVQARQVAHHYLMEYPLGKKLNNFLSLYYQNLDYDQQQGRESILEMFKTIVDTFPQKTLEEESSVMFINLAARLVNDPSPECRKTVATIMITILSKIDKSSKNRLYEVAQIWLQQDKESMRRLAAQVIGLFISLEKEDFAARIDQTLPLLVDQFLSNNNKPGRFVLLNQNRIDEDDDEENEGETKLDSGTGELIRDHLLFQVLQVLGKIITHIPSVLTNEEYNNHWAAIIGHAHNLLSHGHEWVRLGSVQLLGLTLSAVPPEDLAHSLSHPPEDDESVPGVKFLFSIEPKATLRSITLDLLAQLTPDNQLNEKFILQIMKLLVYIGEVLKEVKPKHQAQSDDDEDFLEFDETVSLPWLVRRIRKIINGEIVHAPNSTSVRTMCFNWIAAIAVKLDQPSLSTIGYHLVAPLARELTLGEESDPLRQVARDASQYIKTKLGHDEYHRLLNIATTKMDVKKAQRKTERAQMAVTDPVRAAKRKIHRQQKKKIIKKRKVAYSRISKLSKKFKKDINLDEK